VYSSNADHPSSSVEPLWPLAPRYRRESSNKVPDPAALAEEDRRHDIAVRQEDERYLSEKQATKNQVTLGTPR